MANASLLKWNLTYFLKPSNYSKNPNFVITPPPQCLMISNSHRYSSSYTSTDLQHKETTTPLTKDHTNLIKTIHFHDKDSTFTFAIAAGIILGLVLYYPSLALAATGGRMGGRSSSSSSSRSSSSSSRSSSSRLSSSSDYHTPSSSTNISYYTSTGYAPTPVVVRSNATASWDAMCIWFLLGAITSVVISSIIRGHESGHKETSVVKLQVCLLGMARSLQKDLNEIAEVADTSTSEGLNFILKETVLALLRHPDCCISTYSSVDVKQSTEDGEKRFDQLSIEERGKLDEETLVNVNNIKRKKSTRTQENSGSRNEFIVITILVSVEGSQNLPVINTTTDLKEALQKLGSIPSSKITAVEVLWTPQEDNDTLSEQDVLENYPHLRSLQDGGFPNLTLDYTNSRVEA